MPVIVTTRLEGVPPQAYDQTADHLADALRAADGFIAHAAAADGDGVVTVTELWDDAGDWQRFFDAHVKPNVPRDLPPPAVVELRNAIVR
jgi:heme-degrading monooxygenase HmoA